jgi:hypothetical protein
MPILIDYILGNDDARHRIMKYTAYFMCIGGAIYSVSLLIARLVFWNQGAQAATPLPAHQHLGWPRTLKSPQQVRALHARQTVWKKLRPRQPHAPADPRDSSNAPSRQLPRA